MASKARGNAGFGPSATSLATKVKGPAAVTGQLFAVLTAESLADALQMRVSLAAGQSVITRGGEWVGRHWLRVSRGADQHAGVIEREHRLKTLRSTVTRSWKSAFTKSRPRLAAARESLARAESDRDHAQSGIQAAHRKHAELRSQLEATRARAQESTLRRERLEEEAADVAQEKGITQEALARAGAELDRGLLMLGELDSRRHDLENEREDRRDAVANARSRAQAAQMGARDLLIKIESRRSTRVRCQ